MQVLTKMYAMLSALMTYTGIVGAQKVITVSRGERVVLPCPSLFPTSEKVGFKWRKDGESVLCEYLIEKNKTTGHNCKSGFSVNEEPVGLIITGVRSSDAGDYNCSVTRVIPPPTEKNSLVLILQVNVLPGLTVERTNSSNQSCVELLCSLEGLSPEQVTFTWTRGSEQLLHQNIPTGMSSMLQLCKPQWTDKDTVTCHASYSSNLTLYSKNITLPHTDEECPLFCPVIHVFQISFLIITSLFWTLYCICSCKAQAASPSI